ncbi:MAG TPA: nitroreductase/quinone reductase family protein [Povalibacter sp.]|uniref:nitroreductase/quinone reductase family protein n=1 Tax=Povalibacter sp. TaxID=1962978 RepID=UPI002C2289AC|nr:nitroreductase/quinone reductase family protein [Povalibacter sp.]HMN46073.1 nitroreductase/quinone reductase family protein [Povalibacter sp.]
MDLREALRTDRLIDIVTIGARTGLHRVTEIWFTNIDGRIVICGTPSADGSLGPRKSRSWLANLKANPHFEFCLKESVLCRLTAKAVEVTDRAERKRIMSAPETRWYREQGFSVEDLVNYSPIIDVFFVGEYAYLNTKSC